MIVYRVLPSQKLHGVNPNLNKGCGIRTRNWAHGNDYFRAEYQRKARNCTWRNKLRSSKSQVSFVLNFPNPLGNETHMPTSSLCCVKHAKRHVFGGHLIFLKIPPTQEPTPYYAYSWRVWWILYLLLLVGIKPVPFLCLVKCVYV